MSSTSRRLYRSSYPYALVYAFLLCILLNACGNPGPESFSDGSEASAVAVADNVELPKQRVVLSPDSAFLDPAPDDLRPLGTIADARASIAKMGMELEESKYPLTISFGLYTNLNIYVNEPAYVFSAHGIKCHFSSPAGGAPPDAPSPSPPRACDGHIVVRSSDLEVLTVITTGS